MLLFYFLAGCNFFALLIQRHSTRRPHSTPNNKMAASYIPGRYITSLLILMTHKISIRFKYVLAYSGRTPLEWILQNLHLLWKMEIRWRMKRPRDCTQSWPCLTYSRCHVVLMSNCIILLLFLKYIYLLVYLTGTVHINKHCCKCARVSQEAFFICSGQMLQSQPQHRKQNVRLKLQT